ncbi:MAG: ASKHA domain-containing protein [Desulfosalsimonadaceae bacterium]
MPKIKIYPLGETLRARRGETLADVLYRAGVDMDTPCNGEGICGKCIVCIEFPPNIRSTPHKDISEEQHAGGIRLACQVTPKTDMTVRLLSGFTEEDHRILEGGQDPAFFACESGEEGDVPERRHLRAIEYENRMNPAVRVSLESGRYMCRYEDGTTEEMKAFRQGSTPKGLAVDLGTTTLVATLVSLKTGKEMSTTSSLNPQIRYGHDVVRRIRYASTPEGLDELSAAIREGLNHLIDEICEDSDVAPGEILDVVIGGNTTMLQIAAGIDPSPLGEVPFTVGIESGRTYPVSTFGLEVHPGARVYVPPVLHAYVGADISAGLLVCSDFFSSNGKTLFIDVGTNGEIGVSANGRMRMSSTAAGPAFEGMGISSGMRARIGAVEAATINGRDIEIYTIGNVAASGICGSGIIDLTAVLLKTGVLDPSGRMKRPGQAEGLSESVAGHLEEKEGMAAFRIGDDVWFTQEDVRQVQLAKSAIRAAIDILLEEAGIDAGMLESIVLAGGFGYSLRPQNLEAIGFIPPGTAGKVSFAGNTSRIGCVRMLKNIQYRRFLEKKMKQVEHVSIETRPDFMEKYVEEMEFSVDVVNV